MLLQKAPEYFRARRQALMKANPNAAFLLPANEEFLRNPDVHYPFRQESGFFYLTGFEEPESFLVLANGQTHLFVRARDPEREMWEGERYGTEGALRVFGVDDATGIEDLRARLPELLKGSEKVFYRVGLNEANDRLVLGALEEHRKSLGRSGKAMSPISDPNEVIGEMRLFKKAEEVEILRRVCRISAEAHRQAMSEVKPGMNEFEVEALIDYAFRKQGSQRVGYGSIVAGGKNATCLHYRSNNEGLRDGDLLLIDAGAELDYYTADITRTFPVGRSFSKAQAEIYDLVLKAQTECIAMAKPGATQPQIHQHACEVLIDGMLSLGFFKGERGDIYKSTAFKKYYPHGTGHWLGMDVHDVGLYTRNGEPRKLEPGMVFTIEPGFYVQPGDKDAPEKYRDIGIRIEDDILITADGCEVLTRDVPKDRSAIEALKK